MTYRQQLKKCIQILQAARISETHIKDFSDRVMLYMTRPTVEKVRYELYAYSLEYELFTTLLPPKKGEIVYFRHSDTLAENDQERSYYYKGRLDGIHEMAWLLNSGSQVIKERAQKYENDAATSIANTPVEETNYRRGFVHGMYEASGALGKKDPEMDLLMKRYWSWRRSYIFKIGTPPGNAEMDEWQARWEYLLQNA